MKLCTLASGSSGNSLLVTDGTTHLLIDAGISAKRICAALADLGLSPGDLAGILVTHEHSDHISGLPVLVKRTDCPIYASRGTAAALDYRIAFVTERLRPFRPGESFQVGGLGVETFPTSHDAAESNGYAVSAGGRRAAVVTDLGVVTDQVLQGVKGADLVVCEANHDVDWLKAGPYPYPLKARILGERGHLSNEAGGALALQCAGEGARTVVLAHLSAENNSPARARDTVRHILEDAGAAVGRDVALEVAPRSAPSPLYEV